MMNDAQCSVKAAHGAQCVLLSTCAQNMQCIHTVQRCVLSDVDVDIFGEFRF